MVGRDLGELFPTSREPIGEPVLEVQGTRAVGSFSGVSFEVRAGEIVALAGLVGAGRTEVPAPSSASTRTTRGSVDCKPGPLSPGDTAMALGIGLVPEDRKQQGLGPGAEVDRNIASRLLAVRCPVGLLDGSERAAEDLATAGRSRWPTSTSRPAHPVGRQPAEGGARQVAGHQARVLIIDEPTRGIDVGTKAEVHRLMSGLAGEGVAILMISSRTARGAGHGRPGAGHARGPARPPSMPARQAEEESVMSAPRCRRLDEEPPNGPREP